MSENAINCKLNIRFSSIDVALANIFFFFFLQNVHNSFRIYFHYIYIISKEAVAPAPLAILTYDKWLLIEQEKLNIQSSIFGLLCCFAFNEQIK